MDSLDRRPDITVAIPTFKRADALKYTLGTIQDARAAIPTLSLDIVVSDNASDDGTERVVKDFMNEYPQTPVDYHLQAKNVKYDRNLATVIERSRGRYIFFFGDDDIMLPTALSLVGPHTHQEKAALIHLNYARYDLETGSQLEKRMVRGKGDRNYRDADHFYFDPLIGHFPFMGIDCTTLATVACRTDLAQKALAEFPPTDEDTFMLQSFLYPAILRYQPYAKWIATPQVRYGVRPGLPVTEGIKKVGATFNQKVLSHLQHLGFSGTGIDFMRQTQTPIQDTLFNVGNVQRTASEDIWDYVRKVTWYEDNILNARGR